MICDNGGAKAHNIFVDEGKTLLGPTKASGYLWPRGMALRPRHYFLLQPISMIPSILTNKENQAIKYGESVQLTSNIVPTSYAQMKAGTSSS